MLYTEKKKDGSYQIPRLSKKKYIALQPCDLRPEPKSSKVLISKSSWPIHTDMDFENKKM